MKVSCSTGSEYVFTGGRRDGKKFNLQSGTLNPEYGRITFFKSIFSV
jgi:hypothetical protein